MDNNIFEKVKILVDMETVVETYGLEVHNGTTLCPFHDDTHPSARVYNEAFHCFACGEHHDVISFTQKLFGLLTPLDAVKKLNDDFCLNLTIGGNQSVQKDSRLEALLKEISEKKRKKKTYKEWEEAAYKVVHEYVWLMRKWFSISPQITEECCCEAFVYACQHKEYAEYITARYSSETSQGRLYLNENFKNIKTFLESDERKILDESYFKVVKKRKLADSNHIVA